MNESVPIDPKSSSNQSSRNLFLETCSFFGRHLGLNSSVDHDVALKANLSNDSNNTHEHKHGMTNDKWSCFHSDEMKDILQMKQNLQLSPQEIMDDDEKKNENFGYSFLLDIAQSGLSLSQNQNNPSNALIEEEICGRKRHALFLQRVKAIETHILPPNFGSMLLKISMSLLCLEDGISEQNSELKLAQTICADPQGEEKSEDLFLNAISHWLERKNDNFSTLQFIFALACNPSNETHLRSILHDQNLESNQQGEGNVLANADTIVDLCYRLAVAVHLIDDFVDCAEDELQTTPKIPQGFSSTSALASSLIKSQSSIPESDASRMVSFKTFVDWHDSKFPFMTSSFSAWMRRIIFPRLVSKHDYSPFRIFPEFNSDDSSPFSPQMFGFACASKDFHGKWHRLYSSDVDGLSFNRLQLALFGYNGPTIMIIHEMSSDRGKFGAYTTSRWKESPDFYGSDGNSFLFQMEPHFQIMHPISSNGTYGRRSKRNFNYCKIRGPFSPGQARGIGLGGTIKKPRLFLSECLDKCHALNHDMTFAPGKLLSDKKNEFGDLMARSDFEIDYLEVWGVGGEEVVQKALGAQNQHRAVMDASLHKARKVDKSQFLDDFNSGLIESKAFAHREQIRGRGGN